MITTDILGLLSLKHEMQDLKHTIENSYNDWEIERAMTIYEMKSCEYEDLLDELTNDEIDKYYKILETLN